MKVGVAIDAWKLPVFEKHLKRAGYLATKAVGLDDNTLLLTVETNNPAGLEVVARAANAEAKAI